MNRYEIKEKLGNFYYGLGFKNYCFQQSLDDKFLNKSAKFLKDGQHFPHSVRLGSP